MQGEEGAGGVRAAAAGRGPGRGGRAARACTAGARRTPTRAGLRARQPRGGGARRCVAPRPPSRTLTRKWCCGSCSREPQFLHAHLPPSLPPPPTASVRSRFTEKAGEPETKRGGEREGSSEGRAAAGKESVGGGNSEGGKSSKTESLPGPARAHPALLGLRDSEGRSYDK